MPNLYETDALTILVDWNDDGDYTDVLEDVSDAWLSCRFGFGTNRRSNPQRPTADFGKGTLTLANPQLTPGASSPLTESQLQRRHRCQINQGPTRLADAWLQEGKHVSDSQVDFRLEGLRERDSREEVDISQPAAATTSTATAVTDLLKEALNLSDIDINLNSTPLSLYSFKGPAARYASTFGQVAGGLPTALKSGGFGLYDPTRRPGGLTVYSSSDYLILRATTEFDQEQLWNSAIASFTDRGGVSDQVTLSSSVRQINWNTDGHRSGVAFVLPALTDRQSYQNVKGGMNFYRVANLNVYSGHVEGSGYGLMYYNNFGVAQLAEKITTIRGTISASVGAPTVQADGTVRYVVSGSVSDISGRVQSFSNPLNPLSDFSGWRTASNQFAGADRIYVTLRLSYNVSTTDADQDLIVSNSLSVSQWGRRELTFPVWFASTAEEAMQARIDAYSQPRDIHVVDFSMWQWDQAKTRQIASIEPGDYIGLHIEDPYTRTAINAYVFVMHCEYIFRRNHIPIKRLTCIQTGGMDTAFTTELQWGTELLHWNGETLEW